jgi:hypothetical protein
MTWGGVVAAEATGVGTGIELTAGTEPKSVPFCAKTAPKTPKPAIIMTAQIAAARRIALSQPLQRKPAIRS